MRQTRGLNAGPDSIGYGKSMSEVFHIRYRGGEADQRDIPTRHLAASLEGLDKMGVRFLWAIEIQTTAARSPSSETASLNVFAPTASCVDIPPL